MSEYTCNTAVTDLGNPTCPSLRGVPRRVILAPLYNADGSAVKFANVAAFTKSALQAKFNETDPEERFYPTKEISKVEFSYDDVVAPEDDYGTSAFQKHGNKKLKGVGWQWTDDYANKLSSFNYLQTWGIFEIFSTGHIGCLTDAATRTEIRPKPIKSFYVRPVMDGDKVAMVNIQWTYDLEGSEVYKEKVIDKADVNFDGLSSVDVYALDDAVITVSAYDDAGGTVTVLVDNDADRPVTGLVKADFVLTDDAGGAETITTVTEVGNGVYTFVWTLGKDDYVLDGSKNRYDFTAGTFTVTTS